MLKKIAARLPESWQYELKRIHHRRQIKKGVFLTSEPEYKILQDFIKPGDWVVDIGANIGYYTKRFSELVGPQGRVISFEPIPATFSLLAANVQLFHNKNVTLINAAVSEKLDLAGMSIPSFSTGLKNYYEAHISTTKNRELSILMFSLDSIFDTKNISLIKIDTEGHEEFVLAGMNNLLKKHLPILIIETHSKKIIKYLSSLGYLAERLSKSPNIIFKPNYFTRSLNS